MGQASSGLSPELLNLSGDSGGRPSCVDSGAATVLLVAAEKVETATTANMQSENAEQQVQRVACELGRKSVCAEQGWRELNYH